MNDVRKINICTGMSGLTSFLSCQLLRQLFVAGVRTVQWNKLYEGSEGSAAHLTDLGILGWDMLSNGPYLSRFR